KRWRTRMTEGAMHLMARRGEKASVLWLMNHCADENAMWSHWDPDFTPLHAAIVGNHVDVARALIDGGADINIRDSKHDGDAIGWAQLFGREAIQALLVERGAIPHQD